MCELMRAAPAFDLFTIGHSNFPIDRFVALLQQAEVTAVADVRSVPASRRFPWFSKSNLAKRLAGEGIDYTLMGDMLGGRPRDARLYRNGVADYEAMASEPHYLEGLARLTAQAQCSRICLMCAEREPLESIVAFWSRAASRRAASRLATSCTTEASNRTQRPTGGFWRLLARTATCSRLDSVSDSRQRIAGKLTLSPIGARQITPREPSQQRVDDTGPLSLAPFCAAYER